MAFLRKIVRAVTLWSNADLRRAEVLSETIFYGIGMAMIGVVLTILVATGTFPASVEAMKAHNTLGLTIAKYVLYTLSGVCAYLAATSARDCLRRGRPTTLAKNTLVLGSAALVASATMTVLAMIISANAQYPTPVWVYIIQALVLLARLLFLSVLLMALYTLFEADRRPDVADAVAGLPGTTLPLSKTPANDPRPRPTPAAAYPPPKIVNHPGTAAAASQVPNGAPLAAPHSPALMQQPWPAAGNTGANPASAAAAWPTTASNHQAGLMPLSPQQAFQQYPPQPMPPQAPPAAAGTPVGAHPWAMATAPAGQGMPIATGGAFAGPAAAAGWPQAQPGGHFVLAQPPPASMAVAAPGAPHRGRQGPSLLATYMGFRMGQRAGRRQQQRRMARR